MAAEKERVEREGSLLLLGAREGNVHTRGAQPGAMATLVEAKMAAATPVTSRAGVYPCEPSATRVVSESSLSAATVVFPPTDWHDRARDKEDMAPIPWLCDGEERRAQY